MRQQRLYQVHPERRRRFCAVARDETFGGGDIGDPVEAADFGFDFAAAHRGGQQSPDRLLLAAAVVIRHPPAESHEVFGDIGAGFAKSGDRLEPAAGVVAAVGQTEHIAFAGRVAEGNADHHADLDLRHQRFRDQVVELLIQRNIDDDFCDCHVAEFLFPL